MHDNLPTRCFVEMDAFFSEDICCSSQKTALAVRRRRSATCTHDTEAVLEPVQRAAETSHSHFASGTQPCLQPVVFAQPKTDKEIVQARAEGVPVKTQQDTKYCVGLWEEWREHRNQTTAANIAPHTQLNHSELQHWLTRFVLEVRKKKEMNFPLTAFTTYVVGS